MEPALSQELASEEAPAQDAESKRPSWVALVVKGVLLSVATAFSLGLLVFFVPDGNDYALVTLRKHARLAQQVPRKIVFVGGSNLAFGLDSQAVERVTGAHAVNMGVNGYLGARYMLAEIEPALRPSDVVVLAFEHDNYYKSVDGASKDLLMIVKARPDALSHLSWSQRLGVVQILPYAVQQKLLRFVGVGIHDAQRALQAILGREVEPDGQWELISGIESLAGFNDYGDLTSHFGVQWPYELEVGLPLITLEIDPEVIPLIQSFAERMSERGVRVFLSYTPTLRAYYDEHVGALEDLHGRLSRAKPLIVLGPPSDYVFEKPLFFDTVYHLTMEGRAMRTAKLLEQLRPYLGTQAVLR